jgi:hypothetical protein
LQQQQQQVDPTSFSCQKQQQLQQQQQYINKHPKDTPVADPFRRVVSPSLQQQSSRTKPPSPRHDITNAKPHTSFSSSCRIEQQQQQHHQKQQQEAELLLQQHQEQQQQQVYGIPSATPADKLPGFVPSVAHARDQKRQSHEGVAQQQPAHHDHGLVDSQQRKGRDTPASVAGSDASHNSAPTSGIPNELLDSVLETAKLPVWRPPDVNPSFAGNSGGRPDSLNKVASPAKPPQASPPKSAPVMSSSERDNTSALEELVKHIDASPSPRDSTRTVSSNPGLTPSSNPGLTPSHQGFGGGSSSVGGKNDMADHHPQQHLPHKHPNHPPHLGASGGSVSLTKMSSPSP